MKLYSTGRAAELAGVHLQTILHGCYRGAIGHLKVEQSGGKDRFIISEVDLAAYMADRQQRAGNQAK